MKGVLCITKDGKPSYCKAPPEKRGIGRCNHIAHINPGETIEAFMDRCMQEFPEIMVASKFSSTAKSNDTISKDWNSASYRQARELLDGGETSFCIVQATATGKSSVLTALMDD